MGASSSEENIITLVARMFSWRMKTELSRFCCSRDQLLVSSPPEISKSRSGLKNNFRGITLGIKPIWRINCLPLYALLDYTRRASMLKSMELRLESTASRI